MIKNKLKLLINDGVSIKGLSEFLDSVIDIEEDVDFILDEMNGKKIIDVFNRK